MTECYWAKYEPGQNDNSGNKIQDILARCPEFVIYFCEETPGYFDLYYECTEELLNDMGIPDEALAKINRLLPDNLDERKEILELVADAFEMWLCGHKDKGKAILDDIVDQLKTTREGQGRLCYQSATMWVTGFFWLFYLCLHGTGWIPPGWEPWMLAAALGSLGGAFSVCLNLGKITVNVNQSSKFLISAGGTRAIIAIIAAIACLLAIRAKIILGLAADGERTTPAALTMVEMFFCFLAGFSETFVPNVLRDAEQNAHTNTEPEKPKPAKP